MTVAIGASHFVNCEGAVTGGDLVVELGLDPDLIEAAPKTFSANAPTMLTFASVRHIQRRFASYPKQVYVQTTGASRARSACR